MQNSPSEREKEGGGACTSAAQEDTRGTSGRGNKSPDVVEGYNQQLADRQTVNCICEQRKWNVNYKQKVNGEKGKWKQCGLCRPAKVTYFS